MSEIEAPVQLYVYDLSHGMAGQLSQQLLGAPIEGIWHTSVVVHDVEIYYGQLGIQRSIPGMTHHGDPLKKIDMGKTSIPMEIIEEYLSELGSIFGGDHYNLFDHNCNHMSEELSQFLLGFSNFFHLMIYSSNSVRIEVVLNRLSVTTVDLITKARNTLICSWSLSRSFY
uniref:ARAD1C00594p n=1 Tax=Blastobotrys adeninivorans TaxID=409370 RepID=A0A060SZG7_BLAAD